MNVLSDGTIHRVSRELELDRRDLASTYVLHPLMIVLSQNFRVTEIMEVFQSRLEKMEETRGLQRWVHFVDIQTDPIIHDSFV